MMPIILESENSNSDSNGSDSSYRPGKLKLKRRVVKIEILSERRPLRKPTRKNSGVSALSKGSKESGSSRRTAKGRSQLRPMKTNSTDVISEESESD